MSDEEKIQIAALGLLGILGRKPKRSQSPQGDEGKKADAGFGSDDSGSDSDRPDDAVSDSDSGSDSGSGSGGKPEQNPLRRGKNKKSKPPTLTPAEERIRGEEIERKYGQYKSKGLKERQQKNRERKAKVEAYREAFNKYDTDNSGSISLSELAEGYRLAKMDFQVAQEAMDDHDLDMNGSLSFEEFLKWGLDTNALKQWGRDFELAKNAQITPVPPRTVTDVNDMLKRTTGAKQKGTSSGEKPAGKGSQKAKLDKMVADYLQKKNLVDGEKYAPLSQDNIGAWKTAVNDFNKDGKRNAMNRVFQGFLKAAAGRDASAKKYSGKDIYSVDEDGNVKSIFTDGTAQYAYGNITKYLTDGNVPRGASGMVPILNVLIKEWSGGNVKFKQFVPSGKGKLRQKKKTVKKDAAGRDSQVAIDLLNNWAESSSPDNSRSSGDAAGGEDGDKTPEQGTTDSSSSPSSSSSDEEEGGDEDGSSGESDSSIGSPRSSGSSSPRSSGDEEEGGEDGDKTPEQGTTEKSSDGGDSWAFKKEAMARGLLRPMKMYMISIGQEEPIQVDSIKQALSSRTYIPDIRRFVYKVKPGQIFEYDGNNYVKIKNSDNLKDKDTKYQIVDGKMQTEIEDLIPVEKRRKLLADVQANVDDAGGLQTEFAPQLRF